MWDKKLAEVGRTLGTVVTRLGVFVAPRTCGAFGVKVGACAVDEGVECRGLLACAASHWKYL
jgi:hypothetical protein